MFLEVSKYSHCAPARSQGRHLGRVGSHLVFLYFIDLSGLDNSYLMGGMRDGSPGDNGNMLLMYGRFEWMALHSHDWIL